MDIVFITVDCLRPDRLSCYGYKNIRTVNIDKIASRSLVYTKCRCQAPYTPASHASFFTGLNPYNHGIRAMYQSAMKEDVTTVAEILKSKGYLTAAFVGLDGMSNYGLDKGFSTFDENSSMNKNWITDHGLGLGNDWRNAFNSWADSNKDTKSPRFVWFHYFFTHAGSDRCIPKKYIKAIPGKEGFRHRNYDAKIVWFDTDWLPVITKRFDLNKTIFVITADHGECVMGDKEPTHREHLFDDTLRIPMIVSIPGLPKRVIKKCVRSVDLFPSILSRLGVKMIGVDGVTEMFNPSKSRFTYSETRSTKNFRKSLCSENWKVIFNVSKLERVCDLKNNPEENINLADKFRKKIKKDKEVLTMIEKLKTLGGNGEYAVVEPKNKEDTDIQRSLQSLGYI